MKLVIKLTDILAERHMTQRELAAITGIRPAAISELANNMRTSINRDHLEKIAEALGIEDVRDIIEFVR